MGGLCKNFQISGPILREFMNKKYGYILNQSVLVGFYINSFLKAKFATWGPVVSYKRMSIMIASLVLKHPAMPEM